ncbi:hypothetical protein SERLADRAFT_339737, partial [Serpula lacrymans var. lacrymans S7.9]
LRTDRVRIVALFKKKDGISKEDFDKFWLDDHSKLFNSLPVVKKNILKYEQAHANPVVSQAIGEAGLNVSPWDAMAVFEAATFEALTEVFTDEEYRRVVAAEELKFFEK